MAVVLGILAVIALVMGTRYYRKRRLANQRHAIRSAQSSLYGSQVSMLGSTRSTASRDTITSRNISVANLEGLAPSQRMEAPNAETTDALF